MIDRPLREIALENRTDKEGAHQYTDAYERHFAHLRHRRITLLEIGVGGYSRPDLGGASLRMWKEYFPMAQIIGVDIHDKTGLAEDRITILQGDQSDPVFLDDVAARHGPFDLIIDDGSHVCAHVITSFERLFGHLSDDGIYAIEDLQTSYWSRRFGGSSDVDRSGSTMTFLHALADGLNYAEFDIAGYQPTDFDRWVKSLTFYHNIVFIERGPNLAPSNVLPAHPRAEMLYPAPAPASSTRRAIRRTVPKPMRAAVAKSFRTVRTAAMRANRRLGGPPGSSSRP